MPAEYFAGRTLDVVIAFSNQGGGARLWAAFSDALKRQLPNTIVRGRFNEAGSGTSAANELFALPEGSLAVGLVRPGAIAFPQTHGDEDVHYDLAKAKWIESVERVGQIMVGKAGLPTDIDELRKLKLIYPTDTAADSQTVLAAMLNAVTGIHARIVVGFNNAQRLRAIVTGDGDLYTGVMDNQITTLLQSGEISSVYVLAGDTFPSTVDATRTLQTMLMPDVPKSVVDYILAARTIGRSFYAPPGVSDVDVEQLRAAFAAVLRDPDFLAAVKASDVPVAYVPHEEVETKMNLLLLTDPRVKAEVAKALDCGRQMSEGTLDQCDFGG
jgi:tripartite-type tricarboxylate transporter receptor subunit TctC